MLWVIIEIVYTNDTDDDDLIERLYFNPLKAR